MAEQNWGLLSGLAQGLNQGIDSFRENERYKDDRAERRKADALSKALQLKQLRDSGYDYNDQSGEISQTEKGIKDSEASQLKKQLDVYSEALKLLPEDQRLGTKQGKDLSDKVNSVTQRLSQLYGDDTQSIPEQSTALPMEATKKTRGILPRTSSFLGEPLATKGTGSVIPTESDPVAKAIEEIPGLIKTSKGFLPGQLSKQDRQINDALKKKAAELRIEEEIGPPKQNQATASGYALRMQDAEDAMQALREGGYDRTDISQQRQALFTDPGLDKLPWVGSAANGLISGAARLSGMIDPKLYQQRQAEQNFVNALLRRESGSAISPDEFSKAEEQYFPRRGDSKETLEQKANNRAAAFAALRNESGKAFDKAKAIRDEEIKKRGQKKGLLK